MSRRYQQVQTLADELGLSSKDATQQLKALRVPVVDGWYDAVLYAAINVDPYVSGRSKRGMSLSPRVGLGCVYAVLRPLDVHVSIHDPRGPQWLLLRHAENSAYVKWQYTGKLAQRQQCCTFEVRNFLTDGAPGAYFFTCFDGSHAWAISAKALQNAWNQLREGKEINEVYYNEEHAEHPGGVLRLRLSAADSPFLLKDKKQLGL